MLKNLLCWDFDDILYLKQRVRKTKSSLNYENKANILSWNHADLLLYHYFNKTLLEEDFRSGTQFYEVLQIFREKQKIVGEACLQELEKGAIKDDRKQNHPNEYYLQMCAQIELFYLRYLEYTKDRWNKIWKTVDNTSVGDRYIRAQNRRDVNQDLKYKPVSIQYQIYCGHEQLHLKRRPPRAYGNLSVSTLISPIAPGICVVRFHEAGDIHGDGAPVLLSHFGRGPCRTLAVIAESYCR